MNIKRMELSIKQFDTDWKASAITGKEDVYKVIRPFWGDDIRMYESMFILCLDVRNVPIQYAKISQGGVSGTYVDVKIVAKYAIESLSNAVILAHNHPSGQLKASNMDIQTTKKIRDGLALLDISLLDHIIITPDSYMSMREQGDY